MIGRIIKQITNTLYNQSKSLIHFQSNMIVALKLKRD